MPKTSSRGPLRIPNLTPNQLGLGSSSSTGKGGGTPAPDPLILQLVSLNREAVSGLLPGDIVLLFLDHNPIQAQTLLGELIGQVKEEDAPAVRERGSTRAFVLFAETSPLRCALEVQ